MKIRLDVRESASARQLAQLHSLLGMAKRYVTAAAVLQENHVNPLRSTSQDRLIYLARALGGAVYSLEQPFLDRVGHDGPLAAPSEPECWLRWLAALEPQKVPA